MFVWSLLVVSSLAKSCQAQIGENEITVQATIFTVIAFVMCFIFWCCFIIMCAQRRDCSSTSPSPHQVQTFQNNSINARTTNCAIHDRQRWSAVQDHCFSTSIRNYPQLMTVAYSTSKPDSVYLPQSAQHQNENDPPPSYEETVRMASAV